MQLRKWQLAGWVAGVVWAISLFAQGPAPAGQPRPTAPASPATPARPPAEAQAPAAAPPAPAPSSKETVGPDEVVLTIGPEKLTRAQFEQLRTGLPAQYGFAQQWGDKLFATNYAAFRGLALLAEREKQDQTPEFREQLKFLRTQLLASLTVSRLQAEAQQISQEEQKAYYDAHQAEFEQAQVKAIFVSFNPAAKPVASAGASAAQSEPPKTRTDEEARARAQELRQQLLAGADFATLAAANSDHKESAQKGGDFGTVRRNQLPGSLAEAVFKLKPGELSEPVREGQGYYIVQAQDIRPVYFHEAAATIRETLQQQKFLQSLEKAKQEFPVVLNEKFFGTGEGPAGGLTARPVITGVAPARPGTAGAPAVPAPAPAGTPGKREEKK